MADTMTLNDPQRASLEAQIFEELQRLDDRTLRELRTWLAAPEGQGPSRPGGLTRRQMLMGALLGTAAVATAGVGGTLLTQGQERVQGVAEGAQAVADLSGEVAAWQDRAQALGSQLQEAGDLVNLYERMESVGLDEVVRGGLNAVAALLDRAAQGAASVREGLTAAQNSINQLDEGLAVIDNGLARAEEAVTTLSNLMQALEDRLVEAGQPVRPLTDALGGFFTDLIGRIPFGVGERILGTIERIQAVLGAIPESIQNINEDLIQPLRERFFPKQGDDVQVRLLEPLTGLLFLPAQALLSTLGNLAETWKSALEQPARERLAQRDEIRKEIAALRARQSLPTSPEAP